MDTGVAPLEAFAHLVEIRKGSLDKTHTGMAAQRRNLVGMPCCNNNFMSLLKKGLDNIMSNKTGTTRNKNAHRNLFSYLEK